MTNLAYLKQLEKTGKYVFHGSIKKFDILEPRQAHHKGRPDGDPGVCATDNIDIAIFMAIYRGSQFLVTPPSKAGYDGCDYYATKNVLDAAGAATGYVYLLPKKSFRPFRGEMRSRKKAVPIDVIEVTAADFPYSVREITL